MDDQTEAEGLESPSAIRSVARISQALLFAGIAAALMGLPYVAPFLGPREQEVGRWGLGSICLGLLMITIGAVAGARATQVTPERRTAEATADATEEESAEQPVWRIVLLLACLLACLAVALLQVMPVVLWLILGAITDNVPPFSAATRLAFAAAHAAVAAVALGAMWYALRSP